MAKRLTTLSSPQVGILKSFVYDTAPNHGGGKVHRATRTQRRDLPADGTGNAVEIAVTETFNYAGVGQLLRREGLHFSHLAT